MTLAALRALHEQHMKYVDAVNNATTNQNNYVAWAALHGFREGVRAGGYEPDLMACDMEQIERGNGERPMCCGVFLDWKPAQE